VQFDLDAVWKVLARFVDKDVPACYQKQSPIALEEKAAGIGQRLLLFEGDDSCGGE
jgi:hypothetical protein